MILPEILERTAKKYPDEIALIYKNKKINYKELNALVLKFSNGLKSQGIKKGDIVAVLLPNSPEFIISYFAILKLGCVVLPLNPAYKKFELKFFLSSLNPSLVISSEETAQVICSFKKQIPSLKKIISCKKKISPETISYQQILRKGSFSPLKEKINSSDIATLLYTSGVTGVPRAAALTHKNIFSNIESLNKIEKIKKEDVVLCVLPLFHSFALTVCFLLPIFRGAKILLIEKFAPYPVLETIYRYKVSILVGVPTIFTYFLNLPGVDKKYFSSVRLCLSGGAPISQEVLQKFKEKFEKEILEGYGLTEASPVVCYNYSKGLRKIGSVGVPLPNLELKIVNENGEEVNAEEIGEIIVRGPNVMKEYYNNPEATSEVLKNGWLYTGDIGKKDKDGYFYIVGRKKDVIIVGGFNVYPKEVEDCLMSHPAVLEAAVIGVQDPLKGEAIKAFVVLKKGKQITYEEIMNYCKEKLAPYKVPRYLEFRDELPKSDTGKILKNEL